MVKEELGSSEKAEKTDLSWRRSGKERKRELPRRDESEDFQTLYEEPL